MRAWIQRFLRRSVTDSLEDGPAWQRDANVVDSIRSQDHRRVVAIAKRSDGFFAIRSATFESDDGYEYWDSRGEAGIFETIEMAKAGANEELKRLGGI